MSLFAALLLAAGGSANGLGPEWQPVADPLAEARAGKLYCDTPDHAAKSCEGGVFFRFSDDGAIRSAGLVPINNDPDLAIAMGFSMWEADGAICTKVEQDDIDRMRLMLGAEPYDKPAGQKLLAAFKEAFAPMMVGKTMCERIFSNGDRLFSVAIVDGVHSPEFDGEIAWLDADSGYDLRATENFLDE